MFFSCKVIEALANKGDENHHFKLDGPTNASRKSRRGTIGSTPVLGVVLGVMASGKGNAPGLPPIAGGGLEVIEDNVIGATAKLNFNHASNMEAASPVDDRPMERNLRALASDNGSTPSGSATATPNWKFQVFTEHPDTDFDAETTRGDIKIEMFDRGGKLVESRTFAGVYNPGTSLSVAAPNVSSVKTMESTSALDASGLGFSGRAMLIDHAVLFKDGTAVQQWGTDNGQDGYCISAFDDSKHFPDYIEACKSSREFVVTEAQPPAKLTPWTFQLYTDHPRASHYQGTNDPVTIYMYSEDKLVYAETFAGVHNPGVSVTANSASDITRVQVANDGGDDIFIDWATLSKDGGVVKQGGTDNGMDGYCVSTEERDGFLRTDGTDYLLGGWNCDPKVDFWVNAPDSWKFELFTEHPTIDSATETTIGDIKIEMLDGNGKLVKARKFFGVKNPGTSLSVNAPDVTTVKVSVDGEYKCKNFKLRLFKTRLDKTWQCAMLIDHAALLKDGNTVQQWGTDNGQDGYCISALSDADNKYFPDYIDACVPSKTFE